MMVVTVLPHPENLEGPPTCTIALLEGDPKLVDVDELTSRHLEYAERQWAIPKRPYTELDVLALRLVSLCRGSFLGDPELLQPLRESLLR